MIKCAHKEIFKADNQQRLPSYNIQRLVEEVTNKMNPYQNLNLVWTGKVMLWIALLFNTVVLGYGLGVCYLLRCPLQERTHQAA